MNNGFKISKQYFEKRYEIDFHFCFYLALDILLQIILK